MSTFNPIGSWSSDGMRMCVCVCVCVRACVRACVHACVCVDRMNLKYAVRWHIHISVHSVLCQHYTQAHAYTHILKPFEDSEPTGLKVDIAQRFTHLSCLKHTSILSKTHCQTEWKIINHTKKSYFFVSRVIKTRINIVRCLVLI